MASGRRRSAGAVSRIGYWWKMFYVIILNCLLVHIEWMFSIINYHLITAKVSFSLWAYFTIFTFFCLLFWRISWACGVVLGSAQWFERANVKRPVSSIKDAPLGALPVPFPRSSPPTTATPWLFPPVPLSAVSKNGKPRKWYTPALVGGWCADGDAEDAGWESGGGRTSWGCW